ncbi:MAG: hypothetical protein QOG35_2270 [Solirubrobacteraceae bacterium]|jgi:plastocyanin|nr:hypothetical protein [Solirubrobacteraceae bacterium]
MGGNRGRAAATAIAVGALLALAAPAVASGDRTVLVSDACDPATFNDPANISPQPPGGICQRSDGNEGRRVTFAEFAARVMQKGFHNAWNFDRDHVTLRVGDVLTAVHGRGGELHTFTQVDQFGPGCIPFLNGGQPPPALCDVDVVDGTGLPLLAFQTAVVPGGPAQTFTAASSGTFFFQCLIHPWMRTTVTVR